MLIPFLYASHVVFVVLWIGGVAFVTIVVFPILLKMEDSLEQVIMFQRLEHRFAGHARLYIALTGITGGLLLYYTGQYASLFKMETLGTSLMIIVWAFYLVVLTFEKPMFARLFGNKENIDGKKVFGLLAGFHWVVLGLSLLAVAAGVWQGHGGF